MSTAETIETTETTEDTATEETTKESSSFATQEAGAGETSSDEDSAEGDDEKAEATGDSEEGSDEGYAEFVIPDGVTLEAERLAEATDLFKGLELGQEQAQKLVDWYISDQATAAEKQESAQVEQRANWRKEIESDPDLGGANQKQTAALNWKAVSTFGDEEFAAMLDEGQGDRAPLVRFLAKVGAAIIEDTGGSGAGSDAGNTLEKLYPTMFKSE